MLLTVDIGNSAIKFGVFDGSELTSKFFIPTGRELTAEKIAQQIGDRLSSRVDDAIVCSVVPQVDAVLAVYLLDVLGVNPRFVSSTDDFGLGIDFSVETTGADRLVNSFAVSEKYGAPCVVLSFGTATTIDVVNAKREYLGGLIAPGMKVSAKALANAASKLPEIELKKPAHVIAQTTETAIRSGIVYGQVEMIKGLLRRVIDELDDRPTIVATGGLARMLVSEIAEISTVDDDLTLTGLMLLSKRALSRDK